MTVPCSWDVTCEVCPDFADYDATIRDSALWLASTFLWANTGRQYGVCPVTVRPSQRRMQPVQYQAYPVQPGGGDGYVAGPFLFGGRWFNAGCSVACCGDNACAVVLRGPVDSVELVLVDGEVVSPSAYRVDIAGGAYLLIRTDGECWPVCQDFSRDVDEASTFEVTYGIGRQLPEALMIATALLACEYAKFLSGGRCSLPAKMTRLARQGVEIEVAPPEPAQGRTGIKAVDDVITALNPNGLRQQMRVYSPDLPESCDRFTVIGSGS